MSDRNVGDVNTPYHPDDPFTLTPAGARAAEELEQLRNTRFDLTAKGERTAACIVNRDGAERVLRAVRGAS